VLFFPFVWFSKPPVAARRLGSTFCVHVHASDRKIFHHEVWLATAPNFMRFAFCDAEVIAPRDDQVDMPPERLQLGNGRALREIPAASPWSRGSCAFR
jgi:hypothetical protein